MSTVTAPEWAQQATELRDAGVSQRQIADGLNVPRSTIGDFFRMNGNFRTNDDSATPHSDALDEQAGPGEARTPLQGQQTIDGQEVRAPIEEIRVDGTTQLGFFQFGGKAPTSCKLVLSGGAAVNGGFKKGERICGTFEALIVAANPKDKLDKQTQIVTECDLTLTAKVLDLTVDAD